MHQFKRAVFGIVWLCLFVTSVASGDVAIPPLNRAVTDLTATLTPQETARLESMLRSLSDKKGSQLAVLIVPTTAPEAIEQYSMRVVEQWKLGRKKVEDGVLLLIAKNDRTVRIEVGYGLEGALTDYTTNRIINELIVPQFKAGNFFAGILDGVTAIIKVIEGEQLPPPTTTEFSTSDYLPLIVIGALILGGLTRSLFGLVLGSFASAAIAFIIALFFIHILGALIVSIITFVVTLLGSGIGTGGPGGPFGGSGRGGSGGGFGGGGGRFGGGGSSGKW